MNVTISSGDFMDMPKQHFWQRLAIPPSRISFFLFFLYLPEITKEMDRADCSCLTVNFILFNYIQKFADVRDKLVKEYVIRLKAMLYLKRGLFVIATLTAALNLLTPRANVAWVFPKFLMKDDYIWIQLQNMCSRLNN